MTKLYLKIFLYFWALCGLILFSGLVYDSTHNRTPLSIFSSEKKTVSPAMKLSDDLLSTVAAHDMESLCIAMRMSPDRVTQHIFLIDENNEDLLARPIPQSLVPMVSMLGEDMRTAQMGLNVGRMVTLTDGTQLKAITHIQDESSVFFKVYFLNAVPWFISGLLLSAIACYLFARKLSSDVSKLKKATRSIASGNLSTRISPQFRSRNNEFSDLARDFDHMVERLEIAMLQQKRLIKDVSHELRSPLARLQVALELAFQRSKGTVDKELTNIKNATESLEEIITQILSMPVTERDTFEMSDTIDLGGLLTDLVSNCQTDANNKSVQIVQKYCCEEILVQTRSNILTSVFENILRNAVRYTYEGSKVFVKLECVHNGKCAAVTITDQGPGVPDGDLEKIFQPFYRSDSARSRDKGGYGLGLAIAERTVRLHRGQIIAANASDGGLSVQVILPMTQIEEPEDIPQESPTFVVGHA
ncbi:sensor histidine kinase [Sessilibacter sp. MAH4]